MTQDEVIRRLAARHGTTLAAAAELLRGDPELAETVADDEEPPAIASEGGFFPTEDALHEHIDATKTP